MNARTKAILLAVAVVAVGAVGFALGTGWASGRYLSTIRGTPERTFSEYAGDTAELDAVLEEIRQSSEAAGLLKGMRETLFVLLDGAVAWTVQLEEGKARVHKGILKDAVPTLVVPIAPQMLHNLRAAVADGTLDEAERFNVGYVLFRPCLERIHRMFYFTEPGEKRHLKVDDFMHFRLKNDAGHTYHGQKVEIAATVLNVDGYFFHLPGEVGTPDVTYAVTFDEALELYRLLVYEAERHQDNGAELIKLGRRVEAMLEKARTSERSWH